MGRKSALTEKQKESLEKRIIDDGILASVNRLSNDEDAVVLQLKIMLLFNIRMLARKMMISPIERYRFEFNVHCGRVDLVLFHYDGGVSLVEAKALSDLRSIATAMGQLIIYEQAFLRDYPKYAKTYVNKIICAPRYRKYHEIAEASCLSANIMLFNIMQYDEFKSLIDECKEPALCGGDGL